jgi:hypothetical protein
LNNRSTYTNALMVLLVRSQIHQLTERFIHQSGLFKICADTRYGMDGFFSFKFEIQLYGNEKDQIEEGSIKVYWRVTGFLKKNICEFGKCDLYIGTFKNN